MNINHTYQLHPLESFFESFFSPPLRKEFKQTLASPTSPFNTFQNHGINVSTEENLIKLEVLVPGLSKRDIELAYSDGTISLTGKTTKQVSANVNERSLDMKIELSKEWNLSQAKAKVKDGVLEINVPRKEAEKNIIKIS